MLAWERDERGADGGRGGGAGDDVMVTGVEGPVLGEHAADVAECFELGAEEIGVVGLDEGEVGRGDGRVGGDGARGHAMNLSKDPRVSMGALRSTVFLRAEVVTARGFFVGGRWEDRKFEIGNFR